MSPALMASRAWPTWITNEEPPTEVPSVCLGVIPRYSATIRGEVPAQ